MAPAAPPPPPPARSRRGDGAGEGVHSPEVEAARQLISDLKSTSNTQEQKEKVAQKLAVQAHTVAGAAILLQWGAIGPLVTILRDGTDGGQCEASSALASLAAQGRQYHKAVTASKPIPPLVAILRGGSNKAAMLAAAALATLSEESTQALVIMREGGLFALVRLLRVGTADAQANAAVCVAHLARAGGDYDDEEAEGQPESHAIRQLVSPSANSGAQNDFARAESITLLLGMLQSGKTQMAAAFALSRLAAFHEVNQGAISRGGGVPSLLTLLHGSNDNCSVQAASALAEIARAHCENQAAVAKAGGIGPLLALLTSIKPQARSHAAHALAILASQNRDIQTRCIRRQMPSPLAVLCASLKPWTHSFLLLRFVSHIAQTCASLPVQHFKNEWRATIGRATHLRPARGASHGGLGSR